MSTQIKVSHTYHFPCDLVFKAFTEAEHLKNWWGPKGWAFEVYQSDFHQNGVFHYSQKPADGDKMWVKFVYNKVASREKIEFISSFSDEEGKTARAPFDPNWPLETLVTVTFNEIDGKTTVTLTATPHSPTAEELKTFEGGIEMVQGGYSYTLGQLDEYLKSL